MDPSRLKVGLIGCGRMGRIYAEAFHTYPDCELVAIADVHADRRAEVGARFGVMALFPDAAAMLAAVVPDLVSVVTPTRYIPPAVLACAAAGVRGITAEKPILARLADGDAMRDACRQHNVVFAGGNLQRAMPEVQEAAAWIREGRLGALEGACLRLGRETSGGGVQGLSILRLFADAEVIRVMGWVDPPEAAENELDACHVHGWLELSSGLRCLVVPESEGQRGLEVWGPDGLVRWNWGPPEFFLGRDAAGKRVHCASTYRPYDYSEFGYLTGSLRSTITALQSAATPPRLAISGEDLCIAVEIALALKVSARLGSVPVELPLADRSLALYPVPYRWLGGDATAYHYPDVAGQPLDP